MIPKSDTIARAGSPWLTNALVRRLMTSSSISEEELQQGSIVAIRELLFRVASILSTIAPLVLAFYYILDRDKVPATISSVVGCLMLVHTILLISTNARIVSPLTLLAGSLFLYVGSVLAGRDFTVYWGFSFIGSFYLFLDRRQAIPGAIIVTVVLVAMSFVVLPALQAMHFSSSLICMLVFVELLCSILYYQEERLRSLATLDPLTGALNRRFFMGLLEEAIGLFSRTGVPSVIISVEIDQLARIEEQFGHMEAEVSLINTVALLREQARGEGLVCHYRSEEFAIVMKGKGLAPAVQLAKTLDNAVSNNPPSEKYPLKLNFGIAEIHLGDDIGSWLTRCEEAIKLAREQGSNHLAIKD